MKSNAGILTRIAKPKTQGGVALVLAMMIVTLIAIVATEVSWRFELSASRSGNRWAGMQARAYLEGAEQLAMVVLREDQENAETQNSDHMQEDWQLKNTFPTDHGSITGHLVDAQGRFNINMMKPGAENCNNDKARPNSGVCPAPGSPCDDYSESQRVFIRLLQTFDLGSEDEPQFLNQQQAQEITEAVIDWLDEDSNLRGFGGAESDYYSQIDPPVTIANDEMASVSELMVIKGMVPQLYKHLVAHVIALPKGEVGKIHINTAGENVLRSLRGEKIQDNRVQGCDLGPIDIGESASSDSSEEASGLAAFVHSNEFEEFQDLVGHPDLPYEWTSGGDGFGLSQTLIEIVQSKYFILNSTAVIGEEYARTSKSLIKREVGSQQGDVTLSVIRRTDANF